jgi:hypothetical protein
MSIRFQRQSDDLWAIYDGQTRLETGKTVEDVLFDPRYRDEALLVIFALASQTDANYASAYLGLRAALRGTV